MPPRLRSHAVQARQQAAPYPARAVQRSDGAPVAAVVVSTVADRLHREIDSALSGFLHTSSLAALPPPPPPPPLVPGSGVVAAPAERQELHYDPSQAPNTSPPTQAQAQAQLVAQARGQAQGDVLRQQFPDAIVEGPAAPPAPCHPRKGRYKPPKTTHRNTVTTDKRRAVINAVVMQGLDRADVATAHGLKIKTIHSIIRRFKQTGEADSLRRGGVHHGKYDIERIGDVIKEYICGDERINVKGNKYITNRAIARKLRDDFPYNEDMWAGLETVRNIAQDIRLTYKRLRPVPVQRNTPENKQIRREWAQWAIVHIIPSTVVYIDEASFELQMHPSRGRSIIGERIYEEYDGTQYHQGKVTGVMAINPVLGCVSMRAVAGSFRTPEFRDFLDDVGIQLPSTSQYLFIYDNAPIHRANLLRDRIESYGHRLRKLPPYSPFFNPIEEAFSIWKEGVRRRQIDDEQELEQAMREGAQDITPDLVTKLYKHACTYYNRAIDMEDIMS